MEEAGVELYHMPQNGLNLPRYSAFPVVVTLHDVIPYILPQTCNPAFLRRFMHQMPISPERADMLSLLITPEGISSAIAGSTGEDHSHLCSSEPIYVPLPQVPCREFLRERYGIRGGPLILYVGGFSWRKNVGLLLRAFAAAKKELGPEAVLVMPGRATPEVDGLRQLARGLGIEEQVIFPGYVPVQDLPQFYGAADVFVYPSLYEGFGMPPLEAMACGVPTITSWASALAEIVGEGALQVDPYDAAGLAEAILQVVTDTKLAAELRQKGRDWVQRYSWKKVVKETVLVYEILCLKRQREPSISRPAVPAARSRTYYLAAGLLIRRDDVLLVKGAVDQEIAPASCSQNLASQRPVFAGCFVQDIDGLIGYLLANRFLFIQASWSRAPKSLSRPDEAFFISMVICFSSSRRLPNQLAFLHSPLPEFR